MQFGIVGAACLLAGTSFYLFSAALPIYLNRNEGYSVGTVGFLVGIASLVQLIATLFVGPFVDRRGARLAMRLGALSYVAAALLLFISNSFAVILAARVLQGIGIALFLPSIFSLVPSLVGGNRRGTALGLIGAFNNVALAVAPPLGLWLLGMGPPFLFGAAVLAAAFAIAVSWLLRVGLGTPTVGPLLKYRGAWTSLYLITFLCVVYWGVVSAFLPIEVPPNQVANVGWFFTADAVAVMASRVPFGYVADRYGARWLLVTGAISTAIAISILMISPSFLTLVLAGVATGLSAALLLPPILLELTKRSTEGDRGTAMALYNTSFAGAVGAGSLGGALLVQRFGFHATLTVSLISSLAAAPVALVAVRRFEDR